MDLTQLANFGEFIGGIAVLVTLVYLAVQMRQANRMSRLAAADKLSDSWIEIVKDTVPYTELILSGMARYEDFEPDDKFRFRLIIGATFFNLQNFHTKYRNGVIGDEEWEQQYQIMLFYLAGPGIPAWWSESRAVYGKAFGELVSDVLDGLQAGTIGLPVGTANTYLNAAADQ